MTGGLNLNLDIDSQIIENETNNQSKINKKVIEVEDDPYDNDNFYKTKFNKFNQTSNNDKNTNYTTGYQVDNNNTTVEKDPNKTFTSTIILIV